MDTMDLSSTRLADVLERHGATGVVIARVPGSYNIVLIDANHKTPKVVGRTHSTVSLADALRKLAELD